MPGPFVNAALSVAPAAAGSGDSVTVGAGPFTVQVNDFESVSGGTLVSETVAVTLNTPDAVAVPVMSPVLPCSVSPGGSPVAA